ncbi:MAG: protein kinase [Nocardioides sp.]
MTAAPAPGEPPILAEGEELAPGYRVVELLSRGQAMDVYEVYSEKHWCNLIAKTIRPDRKEPRVRRRLLNEGDVLSRVNHPHLARWIDTVRGPRPVVLTEIVYGDTLEEIIEDSPRRMSAKSLEVLAQQLRSALHALHQIGILHLDVRPANIINRAGTAVLIDLSIARPPGRVPRGYGTPGFMPPEQRSGGFVTEASDAWALAMTLYVAATGVLPDPDQPIPSIRTHRRLPRELADYIDQEVCVARPAPAVY